jgi:hypothetical protein
VGFLLLCGFLIAPTPTSNTGPYSTYATGKAYVLGLLGIVIFKLSLLNSVILLARGRPRLTLTAQGRCLETALKTTSISWSSLQSVDLIGKGTLELTHAGQGEKPLLISSFLKADPVAL